MISAEQFLKILADKELLSPETLRKLQKLVAQSKEPIPAKALAKRLVEKGYLTPALAKRLLGTLEERRPEKTRPAAPQSPQEAPPRAEEEELGFAPTEEEKRKAEVEDDAAPLWPADESPGVVAPSLEGLVPIEPLAELEPIPDMFNLVAPTPAPPEKSAPPPPKVATPTPVGRKAVAPPTPVPAVAGSPAADDVVTGEAVVAGDVVDETTGGRQLAPSRRRTGLVGAIQKIVPKRDRRRKENVWDSTLLLVGGGALLLMLITLGGLVWWFYGQSGEQVLEAADKYYEEQSYTKAIEGYTQYIDTYASDDKKASLARVRRGMAKLRQATEASADPAKSLEVAKEILGEITSEDSFGDVKPELKGVLPPIAEGLAKQAREKTSPDLLEKAREALALVENPNLIPAQQRNKAQLDDIRASLALTQRAIARDDELLKAVAAIGKSIAEKKSREAYAIRGTLLKTYPDLGGNPKLTEAIMRVSAAQQELVAMVAEAKPAEKAPPADLASTTVALASRTLTREIPELKGQIIYALADGAAYGLEASTGRVLWRRFVGGQTDGATLPYPPTPLGAEPGSDALLVDAAAAALGRVEATTGQARWLFAVGEPFTADPVLDGQRILLATPSGRLIVVEVATGNSPGFIRLPQPLRVAPAVDAQRNRLYQVAEHSNLYVLTREGRCEKVVYLAHEPGSITTPPVVLSEFLVVAENRGLDRSVLRVLSLQPREKIPALSQLQQVELEGRVDTKPLVAGARLLVATDRGRVVAFRLSGSDAREPLEKVAQQQTSDRPDVVRFPLLVQDQFWIADDRLTKYLIQSSLGTFQTQWTAFKDNAFRQPCAALGQSVFLVRRRVGLPGILVTAIAMDKPDVLWETTLAAPLVGEPVVQESAGQVEVVTTLGGVIDVPAARMKGPLVADEPVVALAIAETPAVVRDAIRVPDGLLVLSTGPGSEQLAVFDPAVTPKRLRSVILPSPMAASPAVFAGGLLVPSQKGQVFLINPRTGGQMAEPFQPKLSPGQQVAWRPPVLADAESIVLSDGQKAVYRLGVKPQPTANLAALDQVDLAQPVASELAVVGQVVWAVDAAGNLQRLALPKLTPGEPVPLGGPPAWGPRRVGPLGFLATDDEQLLCLDAQGKVAWKAALLHGPLAGTPLVVGDQVLLASASGIVWRAEAASGKELAKLQVGVPLASGPVVFGGQILVAGRDGTLYQVRQP